MNGSDLINLYQLLAVLGSKDFFNSTYKSSETTTINSIIPSVFENLGYNTDVRGFTSNIYSAISSNRGPLMSLCSYKDGIGKDKAHIWAIDGCRVIGWQHSIGGDLYKAGTTAYYHCVWGFGDDADGWYIWANDSVLNDESGNPFLKTTTEQVIIFSKNDAY